MPEIPRAEKQILLLHAFEKKADKTPPKEIKTALERLSEQLGLDKNIS